MSWNNKNTCREKKKKSEARYGVERRTEKGTFLHCLWECKLEQPLWRTVWRFLRKLKVELPYDPAILLMGVFPYKTIIRKVTWEFAWWSSGKDSALSNVGDSSSIPEQGAGSYMLQWRVPHAATETWCSQINKYFFKRYMHPMLATLFTIAQTWKQPKWPSTEE